MAAATPPDRRLPESDQADYEGEAEAAIAYADPVEAARRLALLLEDDCPLEIINAAWRAVELRETRRWLRRRRPALEIGEALLAEAVVKCAQDEAAWQAGLAAAGVLAPPAPLDPAIWTPHTSRSNDEAVCRSLEDLETQYARLDLVLSEINVQHATSRLKPAALTDLGVETDESLRTLKTALRTVDEPLLTGVLAYVVAAPRMISKDRLVLEEKLLGKANEVWPRQQAAQPSSIRFAGLLFLLVRRRQGLPPRPSAVEQFLHQSMASLSPSAVAAYYNGAAAMYVELLPVALEAWFGRITAIRSEVTPLAKKSARKSETIAAMLRSGF